MPAFVTVTGLFVNADSQTIAGIVREVGIDLIQFHGDESPAYCNDHDRPWIKAIRMQAGIDLQEISQQYQAAKALLLDAYTPGVPGGTGEVFDWQRIPEKLQLPLILAGGLNPENITAAVQQVHPYAVDVSGGVEQSKGIKDPEKIAAFVRGVRLAEQ